MERFGTAWEKRGQEVDSGYPEPTLNEDKPVFTVAISAHPSFAGTSKDCRRNATEPRPRWTQRRTSSTFFAGTRARRRDRRSPRRFLAPDAYLSQATGASQGSPGQRRAQTGPIGSSLAC